MQLRSRVGLGTAPLGSDENGPLWWGPQDRATAVATVRAALDAGIDWIDTAPFYGWGRAEEIIGEAIRGRRDEVTILTKCGTLRRADGSWGENGSPGAVRTDLEASLRRLGTDHVDALQLHDPDPEVPVEETVGAIAELVANGKVRHIGLSNHPVDLLRRGSREVGAAFLAWSPLASGFLVDGFDPEDTAEDDVRRRLPWATGEGARRLAGVRAEAAAAGRSLRDYAISWVLQSAYAIVGARTPEEARGLAEFT
jgi:aryl-alcohol dehydrogenase-like predicted oxidoreductase